MRPHASSPINKPKPMRIKVTVPIQKSIRFFIMMLPLFLALAKPACIRNTGAAPIKNHTAKSCSFVSYVTSFLIVSFILNHSKTKKASTDFDPSTPLLSLGVLLRLVYGMSRILQVSCFFLQYPLLSFVFRIISCATWIFFFAILHFAVDKSFYKTYNENVKNIVVHKITDCCTNTIALLSSEILFWSIFFKGRILYSRVKKIQK